MQEDMNHTNVREYYGKVLETSRDLQTNACCSSESMSGELKNALREIHPTVVEKFYGCGSPIPPLLEGLTVLDLGCGTGRDCFLLSRFVGEHGRVIGIDMTEEQLSVGRSYLDYHSEKFGYKQSNVQFQQGLIEDLASVGIEDNSVDVVVSNCVINLSPSKDRVFSEIFRVLKPGGELYFSDIFSLQRIDPKFREDRVLLGECLAGALYIEDFRRLLAKVGCADFRIISDRPLEIGASEIKARLGMIEFRSMTIRAFKLTLEDRCEDYGHVAYYKGSIVNADHEFALDATHNFVSHKPHLVCGNTAQMLMQTRYGDHFRVEGDWSRHFGLFNCDQGDVKLSPYNVAKGSCC